MTVLDKTAAAQEHPSSAPASAGAVQKPTARRRRRKLVVAVALLAAAVAVAVVIADGANSPAPVQERAFGPDNFVVGREAGAVVPVPSTLPPAAPRFHLQGGVFAGMDPDEVVAPSDGPPRGSVFAGMDPGEVVALPERPARGGR